jgi:hypothetical protein
MPRCSISSSAATCQGSVLDRMAFLASTSTITACLGVRLLRSTARFRIRRRNSILTRRRHRLRRASASACRVPRVGFYRLRCPGFVSARRAMSLASTLAPSMAPRASTSTKTVARSRKQSGPMGCRRDRSRHRIPTQHKRRHRLQMSMTRPCQLRRRFPTGPTSSGPCCRRSCRPYSIRAPGRASRSFRRRASDQSRCRAQPRGRPPSRLSRRRAVPSAPALPQRRTSTPNRQPSKRCGPLGSGDRRAAGRIPKGRVPYHRYRRSGLSQIPTSASRTLAMPVDSTHSNRRRRSTISGRSRQCRRLYSIPGCLGFARLKRKTLKWRGSTPGPTRNSPSSLKRIDS